MVNYEAGYNEYLRVAKLTGDLTPEEETRFNLLMETDQDFQRRFAELKTTLIPTLLAELEEYRDSSGKPLPEVVIRPKNILWRMPFSKVAIAASILLIAGIVVWIAINKNQSKLPQGYAGIELILPDGKKVNLSESKGSFTTNFVTLKNTGKELVYHTTSPASVGMNTLTVPPKMDYQLTLADGSKVWLNSMSSIEFPFSFSGKTREIKITGEAFIQVTKNIQQPFIVHLPGGDIKVMGTEFNINTYDAKAVKVSLVEGAVRLTTGKDSIQLKPGQQGIYFEGGNIREYNFNKRNTLGWMQGKYYFERSSLIEIANVISRWYGIRCAIDNDRNNHKIFVGVLDKNEPLENFQKTLEFVADIKSDFDKEGTLHFK